MPARGVDGVDAPDGIDVPTKLLARHQWCDCDVALLTAAARLGLPASGAPTRDCHRDDDPPCCMDMPGIE
jgi:hypothetical protein